jgi:DNA-binding transcriptional regulator YdaS (Cro superfamily)
MKDEASNRALQAVGGSSQLAKQLGINPAAISRWRRYPSTQVISVERATGGMVSRAELRPDLYPPEEYPYRVAS